MQDDARHEHCARLSQAAAALGESHVSLSPPPRPSLPPRPGLLFFSTYTLLVLFWAEIYYQARSLPTGSLRPAFVVMNLSVYVVQVGGRLGRLLAAVLACKLYAATHAVVAAVCCASQLSGSSGTLTPPPGPPPSRFLLSAWQAGLWVYCSLGRPGAAREQLGQQLSGCFLAFVSAAAAFAFLLYGGRLWLMLRRFPIESRGRRKKLREVGLVTSICATCFLFRCAPRRAALAVRGGRGCREDRRGWRVGELQRVGVTLVCAACPLLRCA